MMIRKFKEMKENSVYRTFALVKTVSEKQARNNSVFLLFELSDGETEIIARMFDANLNSLNI